MRKARFVVLLLVVAMVTPGAARAQAPDAAPRERTHRLTAQERFHRAIAREKLTFRKLLRLQREMLAAPATEGGSGMIVPRVARAASSHDDAAYPLTSVDLEGDGADEAIVFVHPAYYSCLCVPGGAIDYAPPGRVSVREPGGGEDWGVDTAGLAGMQVGDVTGDGVADLTLLEQRITGGGSGAIAAVAIHYLVRSTVRLIDGSDGSELWARGYDGVLAIDFAGIVAGALVVASVNMVTGLQVLPDADGDGAPDVFVRTTDYGYLIGFAVVSIAYAVPYAETAHLLSGSDGSISAQVTARGAVVVGCVLLCVVTGQPGMVFAMSDVSGDGIPDLLTTDGVGPRATLAARGWDGTAHWEKLYELETLTPWILPLNGDTADDVLVFSSGSPEALDGTDGEEMWSGIDPDVYIERPMNDANGDGGDDLLASRYEEGFQLVVVAVSGATGTEVWSHGYPRDPDVEGYAYLEYLPSDVTGDGVEDPLVWFEVYDEDGGFAIAREALDGADGTVLWAAGPYTSYQDIPNTSSADLNGNGSNELFRVAGSTVELLDGFDLTPVGTAPLGIDPQDPYTTGALGADLDGDGDQELVLGLDWYFEDPETGFFGWDRTVHALEPGAQLWMI